MESLYPGVPYIEAEHEAQGRAFWYADPTVRLFDYDEDLGAMLTEHCEPGTAVRTLPEAQQEVLIAGLLRRLWPHRCRHTRFSLYQTC
jgi:hypothetical protein